MSGKTGIRCARCRGELRAARLRMGGLRMLMLALVLMMLGIWLLVISPNQPLLAVPGTLLLALAWWLGVRREDVWVCERCQYATRRRDQWIDRQERTAS